MSKRKKVGQCGNSITIKKKKEREMSPNEESTCNLIRIGEKLIGIHEALAGASSRISVVCGKCVRQLSSHR